MYQSQETHPVYAETVSPSTAMRLYEYLLCERYVKPGDVVLDFGCNTGLGLDVLRHMGSRVHGIDVIPSLKPFLDRKYAGTNVEAAIVKEGEMPYPDEFFDVIVAMNIIEHLPDPDGYIRLLYRKLKPGGRLIMSTVNRHIRLFPWQKPFNPHHFVEFSEHSLRKLLEGSFHQNRIHAIYTRPPFFRDYAAEAFGLKMRTAVIWPARNWARKYIRPVLSSVLPGRFPKAVAGIPAQEHHGDHVGEPSFDVLRKEDFAEAFKCLEFSERCSRDCTKLFSISTR